MCEVQKNELIINLFTFLRCPFLTSFLLFLPLPPYSYWFVFLFCIGKLENHRKVRGIELSPIYQPHRINYYKLLNYLIFTIFMLIVFKLHIYMNFSCFFPKERNPHIANKIMLTINLTSNPAWF